MSVGMSTGIFVTGKVALDHGVSPSIASHRQRMSHWMMLCTYKEEGPHGHGCSFFPAGLLPLVMIGHGIGIGGWVSINTRYVFGRPK
jgi:hypothetical protein